MTSVPIFAAVSDWIDYRLSWNASDFALNYVLIHASQVWTPDLLVTNSAKVAEDNEITPQSNYVSLSDDGSCVWIPRFDLAVTQCPVDVTWFPFDEQKCDLIFESWLLPETYLTLEVNNESINLYSFQEPDGWQLLDVTVTTGLTIYDYPMVTFTLHLRRKPLYFVVNLIAPCCLLSLISVTTFMLQPSCQERPGLSVAILLAMSVYQIIVSDKLPSSSNTVPVIVIYFVFVICVCIVAVVLTIIVLQLHLRSESKPLVAMPAWMKDLFCRKLASCVCMKPPQSPSLELPLLRRKSHSFSIGGRLRTHTSPSSRGTNNELLQEIRDLLVSRARKEVEQSYEDAREREIKHDWMLAAAVLDRIFSIVFTIIFVGGTFVFFIVFEIHP